MAIEQYPGQWAREIMGIPEPQRVWREGNRIRQADGSGFADFVSDDQIQQYAIAATRRGEHDQAWFCYMVLAQRSMERAS